MSMLIAQIGHKHSTQISVYPFVENRESKNSSVVNSSVVLDSYYSVCVGYKRADEDFLSLRQISVSELTGWLVSNHDRGLQSREHIASR